ncbi:hypothetical protein D8M04_00095 [Oceanobacillus piezotolerans]|uniref:YkoP-like domain-containing protein n=1 Tax=Oceanobacillus piezotolerans TaxID=2448030 RepID=A0A498DG34_9BACI|nr:hypothetical protein D8M04_00095 [Oceanobacillus piezotolerans]
MKKHLITIWNYLDPLYFSITHLDYVLDHRGQQTILRVRLTKYQGRKVILEDGTIIQRNDLMIKIHLHNVKLLKKIENYDNEVRRALFTYKSVKDSLPYLVDYIQGSGYSDQIKGLIGITSLHKGCRRLGFEMYPLENLCYKAFKRIAFYPIHLLSNNKVMSPPMYLMMSKKVLLNKYKS